MSDDIETKLKIQTIYLYKYWEYLPSFFDKKDFDIINIYEDIKDKCKRGKLKINNKLYDSRRNSCVFGFPTNKNISYLFSYNNLPSFDFKISKIISKIKENVEEFYHTKFDYCLVHIYENGLDNIGWHKDKEALDSDIVSISFGVTRKFRLKKIGKKSGFDYEFGLNSGDLFYMKKGCQRKFKHSVPIEKKIKERRINLTFRKII